MLGKLISHTREHLQILYNTPYQITTVYQLASLLSQHQTAKQGRESGEELL